MKKPIESNSLKLRALESFEKNGKLNPPAWAKLTSFVPTRSAYTYLLRLHRFGLLHRSRDSNQLLVYSLSVSGHKRLAWLRNQFKVAPLPEVIE